MKPSLPKGTRDFLPDAALKRAYLFEVISSVFRTYGFAPIETPAMENLSTLTGKYGEEGDRLLFRVLNNGDFLGNADEAALDRRDSQALAPSIAKRGLRYDLTVPFARFVVMHQNDLPFPFKRYQIQPVWRADRPQKGRYQEFYQCDADVVGSTGLIYEAELIKIYDEVFARLGLRVRIRLNHRKILTALAIAAGAEDRMTQVTMAIDKWDKIGEEGVREELAQRGITPDGIDTLIQLLNSGSVEELEVQLDQDKGREGISEVREVMDYLSEVTLRNTLNFDVRLARGLDYYTGCILEVEAVDARMGSLGGGGRYDDLTGVFGLKGVPGVGISFGAERIFDVMEEQGLFPATLQSAPKILLVSLDPSALRFAFRVASQLRAQGIFVDIYPEALKLQKQLRFANLLGTPYVGIIGADELASGKVLLKEMSSGNQHSVTVEELAKILDSREH